MLFMAKGKRCLESGGGDFQRSGNRGSFPNAVQFGERVNF